MRTELDRLATALNIRSGEGRLVTLLLAQSFFIGLAKIFTSSAATALFINIYGAEMLPYAYISIAFVVTLSGYGYARLEKRLALKQLLIANLGVIFVVPLIFWLLVGFHWVAMALLVWFELVWMLTSLAFWALAGRLFNLRQGKRLFGLIGAGEMVAAIISGGLMRYFVAMLGTPNLLLVAAAGGGGALILLLYILRLYPTKFLKQLQPDQTAALEPDKPESTLDLFQDRYLRLIFSLVAVSFIAYYFVDNVFFALAQLRYTNTDQLAAFVGNFLAVVGVVSLLIRLFMAGPFMNRYGLGGGLLSLPALIGLGVFSSLIAGLIWGPIVLLFLLTTATKLFDSSFRFSLYKAAEQILYQPLPPQRRAQALTVAEGSVQALASGLAGGLLLFLIHVLQFDPLHRYLVLLFILAAWIAIIMWLNREYPAMLVQAISQRRLSGEMVTMVDGDTLAVLEEGLKSPNIGQALYALDILEEINPQSLDNLLRQTLRHPSPVVRREALKRIEQLGHPGNLRAVRLLLKYEKSLPVRAIALRALAALGGSEVLDELEAYIHAPEPQLRRGALVGLLRSGGIEGVLMAGQRLLELVNSPRSADRIFAAEILGEVGISGFYRPLQTLLYDEDIAVRRAAIEAAGRLESAQLWPFIIEMLAWPDLATTATAALVAGGEAVVPALYKALNRNNQPPAVLLRMIRIAGRIGGPEMIELLRPKIDYPDEAVRFQVLTSLSLCRYQANREDISLIEQQIQNELADATWTLAGLVDIGQAEVVAPLNQALHYELGQNRARLFLLLSFIYDSESILKARDTLRIGRHSVEKQAYALEIIDVLVDKKLKPMLLPFIDESLGAEERLEQLSAIFPQKQMGRTQRLISLVEQRPGWLQPWTIACALEAIARLSLERAIPTTVKALSAPFPLVRETAVWTLARLGRDHPLSEIAEAKIWQAIETVAEDPHPSVRLAVKYWELIINGAEVKMLSTIEKVFIIKGMDIFVDMPEQALLEVTNIMEGLHVPAGKTIFEKGDPGSCMYFIYEGRMRVHDGEQTLDELESGNAFGEMALLDAEPRSASVTALEDSRLLRLNQEPFYELMADRHEVARGIIRVLSRRVRALMRRMGQEEEFTQSLHETHPKERDALMEGILDRL